MLERTAGCLESRTLRRLLPSPRSLKSRRALHSTFWNHGAEALELSPLWAVLVQGSGGNLRQMPRQAGQQNISVGGGLFLDFLYPTRTANLIRTYTGWTSDGKESRRKRGELKRLGQRLYTSFAHDPLVADQLSTTEATEVSETDRGDDIVSSLATLLTRMGDRDYDRCWRIYTELDNEAQRLRGGTIIDYLSTSDRAVDAERIMEAFAALDSTMRKAETFSAAIQATLKLNDALSALRIHNTAIREMQSSIASNHLLSYFIDKSMWDDAIKIWAAIQECQVELDDDFLKVIDQLPTLGRRAIQCAWYVQGLIGTDATENRVGDVMLINFAATLVKRALFNNPSVEDRDYLRLLKKLQEWKLDGPAVYNGVMRLLMATNRTKVAVRIYRNIHETRTVKLSHRNLHNLLKIMCHNGDLWGMSAVLEDYFHFHTKPPLGAYRMCMIEFASQGDAVAVHALFDQLRERHRGNYVSDAGLFEPILHVHAVRGEIDQVIKAFNQLGAVHGLRANLNCWNILIHAYGEAGDADGAMDCFEKLLAIPDIKPDHYSFGTVMGICATRGDSELAIALYCLADKFNIPKGAAMVDCLVLTHIQDGLLRKAEDICEEALHAQLVGTTTRMWNSLLVAYALRRDTVNVDRILRRMLEAKVPCDGFTYSALMQSLAMIKQPDRAYDILTEVMPEAGIKPNQFHYAVAMGAFLYTGHTAKVFKVRERMLRAGLHTTTDSSVLAIKAAAIEDRKIFSTGTVKEQLARAKEIFQEVVETVKPEDLGGSGRRDTRRSPLPVARASMLSSYLMFVLGQNDKFESVKELSARLLKLLQKHKQHLPPLEILSALMNSYLREGNHEAVEELWDLSVSRAKEQGTPIKRISPFQGDAEAPSEGEMSILERPKIVSVYQLELGNALTIYMNSLSAQSRVEELPGVINALLEDGFALNNNNWNQYVQLLAQKYRWRLAFETCEKVLMPNWTGWARVRWELPVRNRLPLEIRAARKQSRHCRPKYHTLLYLARAYLEIQVAAAESRHTQNLLAEMEKRCPMTLRAIRTMRRSGEELEEQVLAGC